MIMPESLYEKFIDIVFKRTGLFYESNKMYFVQKRIEKRMEELGVETFKDYYQLIKFSADQTEFYNFVNELTVNETYFFRDFPQMQNFAEEILPLVVKEKEKNNDYTLRIWSAACSTGEEPYTISIILQEMLDHPERWDIQITASDINTEVIEFAKKGIYEERAVKETPDEYLAKYFTYRNRKYLINLNGRKFVKFKQINLIDINEMRHNIGFDFIFCRNVLIYFNDESRRKVIDSFYHSLNRGGFIFLGHSESIGRISSAFKVQKVGSTIVYSKP